MTDEIEVGDLVLVCRSGMQDLYEHMMTTLEIHQAALNDQPALVRAISADGSVVYIEYVGIGSTKVPIVHLQLLLKRWDVLSSALDQ